MPIEQTIQAIIEEFGSTLWIGFITLVITGFALSALKGFVEDLIYYTRARFSDIGFGQRVYYRDEIYMVKSVHFKYIMIYDDKKIIRIPTKLYMSGPIVFPQPRYDDFDENKYHQGPWDGTTERRERPQPSTPGDSGGGTSTPLDVNQLRRDIVDMIYAIILSPDRMKEIVPQLPEDVYHDAKRRVSKLSEKDWQRLNMLLNLSTDMSLDIFEEINERGLPLTQEDIDRAMSKSKEVKSRSAKA